MIAEFLDMAMRRFERRNCNPAMAKRAGGVFRRLVGRGLDHRLIAEVQSRRLRDTVEHTCRHSPFYRRVFRELGLQAKDIQDSVDLRKLPFTTSADIRNWRDFLCMPEDRLAAVFTTSGTTGEPKRVYYSYGEIQTMANFYAAAIRAVHAGPLVSLIALPVSHGLWIGGASVHRAVERAGGLALPLGADEPEATIAWMERFKPTAIFSSPSYMTVLTRQAERRGYRQRVDMILTAGELLTGGHKKLFGDYWQAKVYDSYGSTEIGSAQTIALPECRAFHINDFHVITEILDPDTGLPAREGELVFTTLRREAMPLLRYRSGDRARWTDCGCWLPLSAIELLGRIDDMFIVGDMNIYGRVIAGALEAVPGASGRVAIEISKDNLTDTLLLKVEGEGADEAGTRQALFGVYPELRANTANGNLNLRIEPVAELAGQLKNVSIRDRRER